MVAENKKTPKSGTIKPVASSGAKKPHKKRVMQGVVVSDKMEKTVVVKIDRQIKHKLYKKYVVKSRKFKAHDEKNEAKIGDLISLVETRPLSKSKRWVLQKIIRKAGKAAAISV